MSARPKKGRKRAFEQLTVNLGLDEDDLKKIEEIKQGKCPGDWRAIPREKFLKTKELEGYHKYEELHYKMQRLYIIRCAQPNCYETHHDTVS